MTNDYPILEHDPSSSALIEPSKLIAPIDIAEHCVLTFFQEVIDGLRQDGRTRVVATQKSEMGPHPVYEIDVEGRRLAVMHPGIGAPFAAAILEELIALGCRKFVVCGGAGVLDKAIAAGHILVPASAVRDEGTSYHYLPPSREVSADPQAVAAIERVLQARRYPYLTCKTWTTDAFYRETPGRIRARRAEGCLSVEMEAAAFFAVAQFRGVPLGQVLYGGDDVSGDDWDPRGWNLRTSVRARVFWLAAEACLAL
jgi:uridine phosphorylase